MICILIFERKCLWSEITFQTPQARMGYIGQHLTSIVTGYRGGMSGARGYDPPHRRRKRCLWRDKNLLSCGSTYQCANCQSNVSSVQENV